MYCSASHVRDAAAAAAAVCVDPVLLETSGAPELSAWCCYLQDARPGVSEYVLSSQRLATRLSSCRRGPLFRV